MRTATEAREVITEDTATTDPQMATIVERLRKQRDEIYGEYEKKGQKQGYEWATEASYSDLLYATNHSYHTTYGMYKTYEFSAYEEVWEEFVGEIFKEDPRLTYDDLNNPTPLMESWIEGWFAGISDFWNEVSNKL